MVSGANNTNKPNGDGKSRFPLSALNKNRQLAAAVPATNSKKNIGNAATIAIPPNSVKNTASAPTRTVNVSNVVNAQNTVDALDDFEQPKYHAKKAQTKQTKQAVEEARKEAENPITCATSSDWILDKEKRQERAQIMATQTAKHAYNQAVRLEDERLRKLQENRFTIGQKGVQAPKKARNATVKHGVLFDDQQPGLPWSEDCGYEKGHKCTFQDPSGKWWFFKPRFWIIRNREVNTVTEVAILSNNDTGLKHTPVETWTEYINIKPKGASSSYVPQRSGAPVLELATMYSQRPFDRETMVVHVGRPETREVDCDELEKIGRLDKKSLDIVIAEGKKRVGKRSVKANN